MSNRLIGRALEQSYAPFAGPSTEEQIILTADESGAQQVRAQSLTDEGGYRANFANSSLAVSIGTCTFTNGSNTVTGTALDTYDLHVGDYVYLNADTFTAAVAVSYFTSTTITLVSNYTGTGGSGASSRQLLQSVTGTGSTITVASGVCTMASGTTSDIVCELARLADYLPMEKTSGLSISQRIANQTINVGFSSKDVTPTNIFAYFTFGGTTNTTVKTRTGWNPTTAPSASEIEEYTITLPNGLTTATSNRYKVMVLADRTVFFINEVLVSTHRKVSPHPHNILHSVIRIENGTTPAGSTNVVVDFDYIRNTNSLAIEPTSYDTAVISDVVPMNILSTYSASDVITINTVLATVNTSQFRTIFVSGQAGTTGVITPEWFNSVTNSWVGTRLMSAAGGAVATTIGTTFGRWAIPVYGTILRFRLSTATTAGNTQLEITGCREAVSSPPTTVSITGTVTTTASGAAAHDAAVSGNPVRIAGRALTTNYNAVATGDTADLVTTLVGALVTRPYAIPELDWMASDSITNSTTAVQLKAATASNKTYMTGLTIASATLGSAIELQIRDTPIASTTATIAANTLVMSATYNWRVGDMIYVTASTVTGLSAGSYYYLLTVSGANLTFSATRGGGTLSISGTTVSATLAHVLFRTQLQTTALPLVDITFKTPLPTGTGLALEACTPTAATGRIDIHARGYVAP